MVSSSGMTLSKPASAMLAQATALKPHMMFLPRQGTSTRFATGSQARPVMFWRAIEAASRHWATVPPSMSATPAAAMPEPAPHST